jgi:hypothetical protein
VGDRYTVAFALRVDAGLPAGVCTVVLQPAEKADALVMGETAITQRSRQFALSHPPERELSVAVGSFAELVGSDVGSAAVQPGEPLTVTLTWRALGSATVDDTAFVHLVGRDGRIWAQSDQYPAAGAAATVTWVAGEIIIDRHRLSVPDDIAPGEYALYAGLYNAEDGTREPLTIGGALLDEDRIQVGAIVILP